MQGRAARRAQHVPMTHDEPANGTALPSRRAILAGVLAATIAAVGYGLTAAPDVGWDDSTEFVAVAESWGVAHPPGYPLHSLLSGMAAHVFPSHSALAVNLVSAVCAAVAIGLAAWTIARAHRCTWAALLAAVIVGLGIAAGRTLWQNSVVAEVYALHLLLAAGLVAVLFACATARAGTQPCLGIGAAALFGAGLAHHPLILCLAPVAVAAVAMARPQKGPSARARCGYVAGVALAALLPLLAYLYLPLASCGDPPFDWGNPETFRSFVHHVTCRQYAHLTGVSPPLFVGVVLWSALRSLPEELPLAVIPLVPVGLWVMWKAGRVAFWAVLLTLLLVVMVGASTAADYNPPYFTPLWWLLGVLGALGSVRLLEGGAVGRWVGALLLVLTAANVAWLVRSNYAVCEQRGNDLPARYVSVILHALPRNSVLITYDDALSNLTLHARLLRGARPDVDIISLGHLYSVGSDEVLRRNFPDLVLPLDGYYYPEWPSPGAKALCITDEEVFLRDLVARNAANRPVYVDFAPQLEWLAPRGLPAGHLVRVEPERVERVPAAALQEHDRLLRDLNRLAREDSRLARDPGAQTVYSLAHNALGWYWLRRDDYDRAEAAFLRALAVYPEHAATHGNLGSFYAQTRRPDKARHHFEVAKRLAPWDPKHPANYALFLELVGDHKQATVERRRAAALGG